MSGAQKRVIVLGAGRIGATIAADISADLQFDVTIADRDTVRLNNAPADERAILDVTDKASLAELVRDYDLVIGALPSHLGYGVLKTMIETRRPYCDISFMEEDASSLDILAKERGVCAVVDCGLAPGLTHMLAAYSYRQLAHTERIAIYVGGLPKQRCWPFQYKAPFSPDDVIEEYTRPARMVEAGATVTKEPLSEVEQIDFPHIGTLEAFNTDGLRSLLTSLDVPFCSEKTLRYPGHAEIINVLRHIGAFDTKKIAIDGVDSKIAPRDVTSKLLRDAWKFEPREHDITVMRVDVVGKSTDGSPVRHRWELFDRYDEAMQTSSMARTTAFPVTSVARMMASGELASSPGVHSPEYVGLKASWMKKLLADLEQRGVIVQRIE